MPRKNARPAAQKRRRKMREKAREKLGVPRHDRRPGGWPHGYVMLEEKASLTPAMWAALALIKER